MTVSEFLLQKSEELLSYSNPGKYEGQIIEVGKRTTTRDFVIHEPLKGQLEAMTRCEVVDEASRGSLHLLLHRWKPKTDETPGAGLPFKTPESLKTVMNEMRLPRCYPYDCGRGQDIPGRMDIIFGEGLEIVCHTPRFRATRASLALWYDFKTRITSCFLTVTDGELGQMLEVVRSLKALASHPLLLPIALYWACSQSLRRDIRDVHGKMKEVQESIGLLRRYLKVDPPKASTTKTEKTTKESKERAPTLSELHAMIVEQHALLTRGLAEFTEELGKSCLGALERIEVLGEEDENGISACPYWLDEDAHLELRKLLSHTEISTKCELRHREQLLSRVGIQLQVLYNLMQSRIGDETLRDSSAMKSIAVLTMVFLPSTALATIFSMSTFFDESAGDAHMVVSRESWIFWAISIPLTLLVLTCYFVWVQRKWLQELLQREKPHDVEDGGSPKPIEKVLKESEVSEVQRRV